MFQIQYFADGLGGWSKMPGMAMVDFPTWEMAQAEFAKFHPLPFKAALFRILDLDTLKIYSVHPVYSAIPIRSTDRRGDPDSLNQYKKRGTSVYGIRSSDDVKGASPGYLKRAKEKNRPILPYKSPWERRKNPVLREKFEVLMGILDVAAYLLLPKGEAENYTKGARLLVQELSRLGMEEKGGKQL